MAIIDTYTQQPAEKSYRAFDYAEDCEEFGDAPVSATATVSPSGLTIDGPAVVGSQVRFWISGGTSGQKYKLTITTTTSIGRIKQDEAWVKIQEV